MHCRAGLPLLPLLHCRCCRYCNSMETPDVIVHTLSLLPRASAQYVCRPAGSEQALFIQQLPAITLDP